MTVLVRRECRSCHASVVWGVTRNNKAIPLDAEPSEDGNCLLGDDLKVDVLGPLELEMHDRAAQPLRLSHFVTCPQSGEWRR